MTAEVALAIQQHQVAESKPNLRALVDDVRRAADREQKSGRRDALATLHAGLHMGLLDPKSEDVTAEDAAAFRRTWRIRDDDAEAERL